MTDLAIIVGLTVGCCLVVGGLGLAVLHQRRHGSLRNQLVVAALTPVTAVAASVGANAYLMFLSPHDSGVVVLALAVSLVLALGGAWLITRRIARASAQLGASVGLLVADGTARVSSTPPGADSMPEPASGRDGAVPTELQTVQRELAEARRTLAASRRRERNTERARQELIAFMSHDLRTPLAGLRALTEGLEDGVIRDVPRALGQLRTTVGRMTGLVEDLFELSRVQGPLPGHTAAVSMTEIVGDVAEELDPAATAAGVDLSADVPIDDRLAVVGDGDALARALANLVSNAVRHTEPDGRVRVEASRAVDGRLRVSVTDGCGGIPAEHLERVFDTGWRGTSARTVPTTGGEPAGAGLGLAIAKGVVAAHQGSIGVRNVDGGCRFDVELPGADRTRPVGDHP